MQRISNKVMIGLCCCSFLCCSMAVSCRLGESLDGYSSDSQVDASGGSEDSLVLRDANGGAGAGGSGGTGGGGVVEGPSCKGLAKECGDKRDKSCCSNLRVPGGSFPMGRGSNGSDKCPSYLSCGSDIDPDINPDKDHELPEHDVTVSEFYLDEFEVTVGRFRKFVEAYDEAETKPKVGAGAHPRIPGSGWQAEWDGALPGMADDLKKALKCKSGFYTWRDTARDTEQHPINCMDWYVAFAFCAWDGGRLPTEAEWEKAAAGGDENRLFPWGSAVPDRERAAYNCGYSDDVFGDSCLFADIARVGMLPAGQGRWGHKDLAGNMNEWVLDAYDAAWYSGNGNECIDCANLTFTADSPRVARGATFYNVASNLRATQRFGRASSFDYRRGVRCARDGKM